MFAERKPLKRPLVLAATHGMELVSAIEFDQVNEDYRNNYSRQWLDSPDGFPISPHIPLTREPVKSRVIRSYLSNLLPEGPVLHEAAVRHRVDLTSMFALSMYLSREPAGAVGYELQTDVLLVTNEKRPNARELPLDELSQRVRNRDKQPFSIWDGQFFQSLAGVRDKIQVLSHDKRLYLVSGSLSSTHILKPERRNGGSGMLVANEHFCMSLAAAVGLSVASVDLLRLPEPVLLVERFDRKKPLSDDRLFLPGQVERIHVVDGCQALGAHSSSKYEVTAGHGDIRLRLDGIGVSRAIRACLSMHATNGRDNYNHSLGHIQCTYREWCRPRQEHFIFHGPIRSLAGAGV